MDKKQELNGLLIEDVQKQRSEWRKKGWSIPDIRGGKQIWYELVQKLVKLLQSGEKCDLNTVPFTGDLVDTQTWRVYAPFLKGIGLVYNHSGSLVLTEKGQSFAEKPSKRKLADFIQDRFRLFGEILDIISEAPVTIDEVNQIICKQYGLNWNNLSHTRKRMDWLEILGLINAIGSHKWEITKEGIEALKDWYIVNPEILEYEDSDIDEIEIIEPPIEIAVLLQKLEESPEMHKKRCTYNIWVPSPNRIENLRIIIQFALNRVSRKDLFEFIENEFKLKLSSVESMLPFLKASGLLEEISRNVYIATAAARAWIETGNDLDFIRILHVHMRFVGEILSYSKNDVMRNDIYHKGRSYCMNNEKIRWIVGFLLEAGLLEQPQYLHIKTTKMGRTFVKTLPLEKAIECEISKKNVNNTDYLSERRSSKLNEICERLSASATNPFKEGKNPGVAFEEAISEIFSYMGFKAEHVGGSGDTDVVLKWKYNNDMFVAIVDGKSKSNGQVSHGDISDIALETHKEKNNADFVAVIGPGFTGDTIRDFSLKKEYALITDKQLIEIANASEMLGLSIQEMSLMFRSPDGFSQLEEIISLKKRELDVISEIISQFCNKQELLESLSPRDLFLLLLNSNISPSLEELISGFNVLSNDQIGILKRVCNNSNAENNQYILCDERRTINRMRAIADTIEKGME